jgi:hypothetical protein
MDCGNHSDILGIAAEASALKRGKFEKVSVEHAQAVLAIFRGPNSAKRGIEDAEIDSNSGMSFMQSLANAHKVYAMS